MNQILHFPMIKILIKLKIFKIIYKTISLSLINDKAINNYKKKILFDYCY